MQNINPGTDDEKIEMGNHKPVKQIDALAPMLLSMSSQKNSPLPPSASREGRLCGPYDTLPPKQSPLSPSASPEGRFYGPYDTLPPKQSLPPSISPEGWLYGPYNTLPPKRPQSTPLTLLPHNSNQSSDTKHVRDEIDDFWEDSKAVHKISKSSLKLKKWDGRYICRFCEKSYSFQMHVRQHQQGLTYGVSACTKMQEGDVWDPGECQERRWHHNSQGKCVTSLGPENPDVYLEIRRKLAADRQAYKERKVLVTLAATVTVSHARVSGCLDDVHMYDTNKGQMAMEQVETTTTATEQKE